MGELVYIDGAKAKRGQTIDAAWAAYLAARERAEHSRDVEDGIAAGKAWRAFLELFEVRK